MEVPSEKWNPWVDVEEEGKDDIIVGKTEKRTKRKKSEGRKEQEELARKGIEVRVERKWNEKRIWNWVRKHCNPTPGYDPELRMRHLTQPQFEEWLDKIPALTNMHPGLSFDEKQIIRDYYLMVNIDWEKLEREERKSNPHLRLVEKRPVEPS